MKYVMTLMGLLLFTAPVSAQVRWFEIEMFIFKRDDISQVKEVLDKQSHILKQGPTLDLITEQLQFNAQSHCDALQGKANTQDTELNAQNEMAAVETYESQVIESISTQQLESEFLTEQDDASTFNSENLSTVNVEFADPNCHTINSNVIDVASLPVIIDALPQTHTDYPYLLSPEQLQLSQQLKKLRNVTPISHIGWRFPEWSIRRAPTLRLFGGDNLANQFNIINGAITPKLLHQDEVTDEQQLNAIFNQLIGDTENGSTVMAPLQNEVNDIVWELEGRFKVYIRNNYLTIESEFNLTEPDTMLGSLKQYYFNQFKRVISGQIHYFDHPKMGIILQIRRFNH